MYGVLVTIALGAAVAFFVSGALWGRKLEQKATGAALNEYHRLGRISVSVIAELEARLPWLKRHL